jgi:hypothetical protein
MEEQEIADMVKAWIDGNRLAQQTDMSCYDIARALDYKPNTIEWEASVQGSAQYRFNGLAY